MKFRCERDSLLEALTTAGRAVTARGNSSPSLSGVLTTTVGNHLVVTGTDHDLTIVVDVEVIGITDGSVVTPSRLLIDIVRSMEPGAVTIETGDEMVEISAARSRFSLRTYPTDEFPVHLDADPPSTSLPGAKLINALRQVVRAASNDDARPLLTGVLIAAEGTGIRLVATDSYRLALSDIKGSGPVLNSPQILVPARALSELQRIPVLSRGLGNEPTAPSEFTDVENEDQRNTTAESTNNNSSSSIGLSFGDHNVTFTIGNVRVSTRLLDGAYPEYGQLIPPDYPNRLHVGKDSLLDALRRVRLLVRDNTTPVRLSMRPGGVDLTVVSQDIGDASETVDADYDGEDLTIAFNPGFLIDGVEAVSGDEVLLLTVDASKPATVQGTEEDNFQYLLMPVRVS